MSEWEIEQIDSSILIKFHLVHVSIRSAFKQSLPSSILCVCAKIFVHFPNRYFLQSISKEHSQCAMWVSEWDEEKVVEERRWENAQKLVIYVATNHILSHPSLLKVSLYYTLHCMRAWGFNYHFAALNFVIKKEYYIHVKVAGWECISMLMFKLISLEYSWQLDILK